MIRSASGTNFHSSETQCTSNISPLSDADLQPTKSGGVVPISKSFSLLSANTVVDTVSDKNKDSFRHRDLNLNKLKLNMLLRWSDKEDGLSVIFYMRQNLPPSCLHHAHRSRRANLRPASLIFSVLINFNSWSARIGSRQEESERAITKQHQLYLFARSNDATMSPGHLQCVRHQELGAHHRH